MKHSLNLRIWHWLNAIIVFGILATVFLRDSFFSIKANSQILVEKLAEFHVTAEAAKAAAKTIRFGMWEWHIILGYVLAILVVYRILIYFTDKSAKESFSQLSLHKKGVRSLYYVVYATLFFMSASGLAMEFHTELALSKSFTHDIQELHELFYNIVLYFVPLHIIGVILAENKDEPGLLSSMVHGK